MATIRAQSLSTELEPLVTRSSRLRVHSVFRRACNLIVRENGHLVEDVVPNGLVTIAVSELGNLPNGILVSPPSQFGFEQQVHAGQYGFLCDGHLQIQSITIDLHNVALWDPSLVPLQRAPWGHGWQDRWTLAWQTAAAESAPQSLAGAAQGTSNRSGYSAFPDRAKGHIRQVLAGCAELDSEIASAAAEMLIGLGPGLTPSGDDFLIGVLGGLWCHPADVQRRTFVQDLSRGIVAASHRTTDVSRVYLKWAARGCVTQRLHALARAIVRSQTFGQVTRLTQQALAVGSTSGADGVYGLLLGLSIWKDVWN